MKIVGNTAIELLDVTFIRASHDESLTAARFSASVENRRSEETVRRRVES